MKNLIVVGDLHLRDKEPYFSQWKDFMEWLYSSEYHNSDNSILFLGDLVESIDTPHELLELYIDYFNNRSKFEKIFILTGNHDRNLETNLLSIFRPLKKVEVIDSWVFKKIENLNCLLLPHIEANAYETYSNLSNIITDSIDYCFHHLEDETEHFSNKYVDLSKLNVANYLCGHIHTQTITKKGRYLGSPTFNSLNEKDKIPYIASIDIKTKKYTLIEVPIWVEYLTVQYPQELPTPTKKYPIYTIYDSIDKEESILYYTNIAKEKGIPFYCRRVHSKSIKDDSLIVQDKEDSIQLKEKSLIDYFNEYQKLNNVSDEIATVCSQILTKVTNI